MNHYEVYLPRSPADTVCTGSSRSTAPSAGGSESKTKKNQQTRGLYGGRHHR